MEPIILLAKWYKCRPSSFHKMKVAFLVFALVLLQAVTCQAAARQRRSPAHRATHRKNFTDPVRKFRTYISRWRQRQIKL